MWDALQVFAQTPSATETTEKLALKTDEDAGVAKAPPPQGWVGTYHAAGGNVQDGKNTSAFDVGEGQRLAPARNGVWKRSKLKRLLGHRVVGHRVASGRAFRRRIHLPRGDR